MRVVNNTEVNYNEDPIRFWDFEQYQSIGNDCTLYIGAHPKNEIFHFLVIFYGLVMINPGFSKQHMDMTIVRLIKARIYV